MTSKFMTGDLVQTPLGKGVVREARANGWVAIEVNGRSVVVNESAIAPLDSRTRKKSKKTRAPADPASAPEPPGSRLAPAELDLHGLRVDEALARAEQALNDALLADLSELRLVHGQSGGRIRAALHRWLRGIPSIRGFRIDPRNAGVTIVTL